MPTLPFARTRISPVAVALAAALGFAVVTGVVTRNADAIPRVYSDAQAILDQHDYCPAADYAAIHMKETGLPVLFVGIPVATAGALVHVDTSGNTGTSLPSVAASSSGYADEIDFVGTVTRGGIVGTAGIELSYSCDGGITTKTIRLGTATSFAIPYLGAVVSFTSAGTLVEGDVFLRFRTTAPHWDGDGIASVRTSLAAQTKQARSWVVIGDVRNSTDAGYITTALNAYETTNRRFCTARAQVRDQILTSLPKMSRRRANMAGAPSLTFAEVGASGDTITRSAGSWIDDGFAVGHVVTVAGSASNNVTGTIASLTATVITLDTTDLANEGPVAGCTVVGSPGLVFAEVGSTGDTITRSSGSWITEGFAVGDTIRFTGTTGNNVTAVIAGLTATVITLGSEDLAAETIASHLVTAVKVLTKASAVAAAETAFEAVRPQKRIDLGYGRARKLSPLTGWLMRRPVQWAASVREYQHDAHITTWWVDLGGLDGWTLEDEDGTLVEHDDFLDGGATVAGFTSFRTWPDEPGTFIAMSLTRDAEGSVLQLTNNMAVTDIACTVAQRTGQKFVGQSLVLNRDGTATSGALDRCEERVNSELTRLLLTDLFGEGQRASEARWKANRGDVLNVPGARLRGRVRLVLNGVVHEVDTWVDVITNGAGA